MDGETGASAWKIGQQLFAIRDNQLYVEKDYASFKQFCKKELPYEYRTAINYIHISQKFDLDEAKQLGSSSLLELAQKGLSDKDRKKLFKKAASISVRELKAEVKQIKSANPDPNAKKPPKPASAYKKFVGQMWEGKRDKKDPKTVMVWLDDDIAFEIKILDNKVVVKTVKGKDVAEEK